MEQIKKQHAPHDILSNIFSRLSIKCLTRFRCASKFLDDIISEPNFRRYHFEQSILKHDPLIFTHRTLKENIISINEMQLHDNKVQVKFGAIGHLITSSPHHLVGTCNGLLCFAPRDNEEPLLVCNPVTGEHVTLARATFIPPPGSCAPMFGFGFCPSTKEHKVVRIFYPNVITRDGSEFHMTAEVYTLGSAGPWRKVKNFSYAPQNRPVYADGAIYWMIHAQHILEHEMDHIISFDLASEEFSTVPHPRFGWELSIVDLGGFLSAVDLSHSEMTVWVLKDRLINKWEPEYIFPMPVPHGLDKRFARLICMWETDGILVIWLQDKLFSYDRRTMRLQYLKIWEFPTWLDWDICSAYKPSLLPPKACSDYGEQMRDVLPSFVRDWYLYSDSGIPLVCAKEPLGTHDGIVRCFAKNGMLRN